MFDVQGFLYAISLAYMTVLSIVVFAISVTWPADKLEKKHLSNFVTMFGVILAISIALLTGRRAPSMNTLIALAFLAMLFIGLGLNRSSIIEKRNWLGFAAFMLAATMAQTLYLL